MHASPRDIKVIEEILKDHFIANDLEFTTTQAVALVNEWCADNRKSLNTNWLRPILARACPRAYDSLLYNAYTLFWSTDADYVAKLNDRFNFAT